MKCFKTALVVALITLIPFPAIAQSVKPMKSFSFRTPVYDCNGGDQLLPLDGVHWQWPPATPGAVPAGLPAGPVNKVIHIRKVCIAHWVNGDQGMSYALVGHSGANGDHASPPVIGTGTECADFPQDAPIVFTPGEYLDVHASCTSGTHQVLTTIWYTD